MEVIKILIVDDHTLFRNGLRKLLESMEGIKIVGEATNGLEAIKEVAANIPDVVLMDIAMPQMDGLDATREIHNQFPSVTILLLTMYENEEFLKRSLEYGATGYLIKTASTQELYLAIQTTAKGEPYFSSALSRKMINKFLGEHNSNLVTQDIYSILSNREIEILRLITSGKPNKAIANRLSISIKTVEKHRNNIMQKLEIHNVVDLVKYAIKSGVAHL
ncbi:MAG: response regulator transcription factor [Acidobacteria bacterium]|nr:response regulator transcription factor [Acidobacteriota bacterium]